MSVGGNTHYDPGDGTAGAIRVVNRDGTAVGALAAGSAIIGSIGGLGINVGSTSTAVASTAIDVQVIAATTNLRLVGYSFREDAGATASFVLRNGTGAGDTPLAYVTLAPNESVRDWFGPDGKIAAAGIYLDRISGTIVGQVDTKVVA